MRMKLHRTSFHGAPAGLETAPPAPDVRTGVALEIVLCTLLFLALAACRTSGSASAQDVDALALWMSGSFSSRAQHAAEMALEPAEMRALVAQHGDHADVRMHAVPVWPDRTDGRWLFVERARAEAPSKPEWLRVVHIHVDAGLLESETYLLPGDERRFAGAWKSAAPLSDIGPESLTLREGCALHWSRAEDGSFVGSSEPGACRSDLNGAVDAVSRMTVSPERTTSWDQGFDASGRQVWGVTSGPYNFEREAIEHDGASAK
jgi:CpeT protein